MERSSEHSHSLTVSIRLYQALLALYPPEFRKAYGGPMQQVFHDCCRRTLKEAGAAGLLSLWWWTLYDVVKSAIEEHTQRGVSMSKQTFYQLSGWAMIIGPIIFMIGAWAKNRPSYSPYNFASLPIDRYAVPAATPLLAVGIAFMSLGILGILLRYTEKLDNARILLGTAVIAGLVSLIGVAMLGISDSSPWWEMFSVGMLVQYLALAFFGFIALRHKLLPRWNGLPILSLWFPILVVFLLGLVPWEISSQALSVSWLLSIVLFAGLGHVLKSNVQAVSSAEAA